MAKYEIKVMDSVQTSGIVYRNCYDYFQTDRDREVAHFSRVNLYDNRYGNAYTKIITKRPKEIANGKKISSTTLHFYSDTNFGVIDGGYVSRGWNTIEIKYSDWIAYADWTGSSYEVRPERRIACDSSYPLYGTVYTEQSQYKPYTVIKYEDVPPEVGSISPNRINIDSRKALKVSWTYKSVDSQNHTGSEIRYSKDNGINWTTNEITGKGTDYEIPGNAFNKNATGLIEVRVKDDQGLWSDYRRVSVTTNEVDQKAPDLIHPVSGYLSGQDPIDFQWKFIGGFDFEEQNKFDLEISTNGTSWDKYTEVSKENKFKLPGESLLSGSYYWRVRTYNEFNDISPYSELGKFDVISNPPIPQIREIDISSKPKIHWNSTEQNSYTLTIKNEENTIVYSYKDVSNDKSHRINKFLYPGKYIAYLFVTNNYNLSSPVVAKEFTIGENDLISPPIKVYKSNFYNLIKTDPNREVLIYRDNECIGKTKDGVFKDYTFISGVSHRYFTRLIEGGNFADSKLEVLRNKLRANTLAIGESPESYMELKYTKDYNPDKTNTLSMVADIKYFDGRVDPVVEYSEFKKSEKSLNFILTDKEELDKLISLIESKKTLLYRDIEGENTYGSILSINYSPNIFGHYSVGFTILKTHYEGVSYD